MTVSRAKRYLANPDHRILFSDLVAEEVERIIARHDHEDLAPHGPVEPEDFRTRVALYESISEGLVKVCGLVGRWGNEDHLVIVSDALKGLFRFAQEANGGKLVYLSMRSYPALLGYHACVLGLISARRWRALNALMGTDVETKYNETKRLSDIIGPAAWSGNERDYWRNMPGFERRYTPFADHLVDGNFGKWCAAFLPTRTSVFDISLFAEAFSAIKNLERTDKSQLQEIYEGQDYNYNWVHTLVGRGGWARDYREKILKRFEDEEFIQTLADAGFGKRDPAFINLCIRIHLRHIERLGWH